MNTKLRNMLFLAGVTLIVSNPCALAHTDVTAEQARDLIDSTPDLIIVDVREPSEYCDATGHIPGALNYPWNSGVLEARYEELPIHSPILVVCGIGGRSNQAANFLDSKGFTMVYDMLGGMMAWIWETSACKYGGGSGTAADPYRIATAGDLMLLGESPEDYDKHFILTADIDLDPNLPGRKVFDSGVIARDMNDAEAGFQGTPFTGVFDGSGHTISHLTIMGRSYLGLFGQLDDGAKVSNLGLETVDVNGTGGSIGGLVGEIVSLESRIAILTNCYSTGAVIGVSSVGGLVGHNNRGSITTSYSTGTVNGTGVFVGGLVGRNYLGDVTCCHSTGAVSGVSSVGGLVGDNFGSITTSYSTVKVKGERLVGGLIGSNGLSELPVPTGGFLTDCYSAGMVDGEEFVGGLAGGNCGSIANSYSTGAVNGARNVGGLVGDNIGSVSNNFWDIETSGQSTSAGGMGKTTTKMQMADTFLEAGWDFVDETANGTEDIWWILEGQDYPRLWWEVIEGGIEVSSVEGFETGDFSKFPWEHYGDETWTWDVTWWLKHSGVYCARAGLIDHDQSTNLQVTLDCVSGNITFYRKVSSELGYDYLKFYIDGVEKGKWSGEEEWARVSLAVTAGTRTFKWTYIKDSSESEGSDTVWIDDIVFPVN